MPARVHAIRITAVSNPFLDPRHYAVGAYMGTREEENSMFGQSWVWEPTYLSCADFVESYGAALIMLAQLQQHFKGVEFEIVPFEETK